MVIDNLDGLKNRAEEIRDANSPSFNTAQRVGSLLWDMLNVDEALANAITSSGGSGGGGGGGEVTLNSPLSDINNAGLGVPQNGQTLVYNNGWGYGTAGSGGSSLSDMWESLTGNSGTYAGVQIHTAHIPDLSDTYLTRSAFTSAVFWGNSFGTSPNTSSALTGKIIAPNGIKIGDANLTWDSVNSALKVDKNFYATGGVSALGNSSGGSGGGTGVTLNEPLRSLNNGTLGSPAEGSEKILKWALDSGTWKWVYADPPVAGSGLTANSWAAYFDGISHQGVTATSGFLKLQNGSLTWGTPEGTLPAYTATNDGQFLMISPTSHQPEWATSTGGSGVAGVNISANTTTTSVAGANETFAVVQGNGITLTPDTVNHAVTVASKIQSVQIQATDPLKSSTSGEQDGGSNGKVHTNIGFKTQDANKVLAGPTSGNSQLLPTFRSLVPADFEAQSVNKVLAGPAVAGTIPEGESEYTAAPTFRALVAADIPNLSSTYLPLAGGTMANTNLVNNMNADLLDGKHLVVPGSTNTSGSYGERVPFIGSDYVMDVGRCMDFHKENGTGDYATRIQLSLDGSGNPYSNIVTLPSGNGILALTTDNVASATKLNTTGTRTVWGQTYWEDGVPRTVNNAPLTGVTGITMTGKLSIGGFEIEKDSNGNLKFNGNIYATGGVSALGNSSGGSGGGSGTALTSPLLDINQSGLVAASAAGKVLVSTGTNNQWGYRNWPSIEDLHNIDGSPGVGDVPIFTHNSLSDSDEWAYTKVVSGIGVPVTSGTQTYATGDVLLQGSGNVTVSRNNNTITISGSGGSSGGGYWISDSNANPSIGFGALSSNRLLISAVYPITFAGSSAPTGTSNDIRLNIGINGTVVPTVAYANDGQVLTANGNYGTVGWSDLPIASISKIGGIKLTSFSSSDPSINAPSTDAGKYYPVQVNSTGEAYVNVPWTGGTSGGISISDVWNALATNDSTKVINNSHINMALGDLSNVSETNVAQGKYLQYNGSNWVPASLSIQDGSSVEQTIGSTIGFTNGAGISTTAASGGNLTITNTGLLGLKIPNDNTWRTGKVILKAGSNVSITGSSTGSGTNVVHEIEITASGTGGTITAIQDSQLSDLFYFYYNDNN